MNETIYFSTGELAKMLGISKQTVIYYDKIGLITPEKRGYKDYRRYSLEQADELDTILTFRSLGVPIKELMAYLNEKSPKRCIDLLHHQKNQIDAEIERLEYIRRKIESRTAILQNVLELDDFNHVKIEEHKTEPLLVEYCKEETQKAYMEAFIRLCHISKQLQVDFMNPIYSILNQKDLQQQNYKAVNCYGILIPKEAPLTDVKHYCTITKPKGIYACTYHKGSPETIPNSYERLNSFILEHGYEVCGHAYEKDLFSTLTNQEHDEFIRKVSVQVKKQT